MTTTPQPGDRVAGTGCVDFPGPRVGIYVGRLASDPRIAAVISDEDVRHCVHANSLRAISAAEGRFVVTARYDTSRSRYRWATVDATSGSVSFHASQEAAERNAEERNAADLPASSSPAVEDERQVRYITVAVLDDGRLVASDRARLHTTRAEARAELDALGDGYDWRVLEVREPGMSTPDVEQLRDDLEQAIYDRDRAREDCQRTGAWGSVDAALHMVDSDVQNRGWETEPGMPDPRELEDEAS